MGAVPRTLEKTNMTTKNTPGPWTKQVSTCTPDRAKVIRIFAGSKIIADVLPGEKQMKANASLIAASPEMLEALLQINALVDDESLSKSELRDLIKDRLRTLPKIEVL